MIGETECLGSALEVTSWQTTTRESEPRHRLSPKTLHRRRLRDKVGGARERRHRFSPTEYDSRSLIRASPVKRHEHDRQKRVRPFWTLRSGASSKWRTPAAAT